jgi:hypothetical protein
MGNVKNSFGIYSAERYPESNFLSLGNGGYIEEGTLNFILGNYYVKLLLFEEGGDIDQENLLKKVAKNILQKVRDKESLPKLLKLFPKPGLIKYSEKFALRNFMGYSFFHHGYLAKYKVEDSEFDCFIVEGDSDQDAQKMLEAYIKYHKSKGRIFEQDQMSFHFVDPYYKNIFFARIENYICGVIKIEDSHHELGKSYLEKLSQALEGVI